MVVDGMCTKGKYFNFSARKAVKASFVSSGQISSGNRSTFDGERVEELKLLVPEETFAPTQPLVVEVPSISESAELVLEGSALAELSCPAP